MAACKVSVSFSSDAKSIVEEAKQFAEENGGSIIGDEHSGRFDARIMGFSKFAGSYEIVGQSMNIVITDKPFLLSCAAIEGAIRQKLRGR